MCRFPRGLKDKQHGNCRVSRIFQGKWDPKGRSALGTECSLATNKWVSRTFCVTRVQEIRTYGFQCIFWESYLILLAMTLVQMVMPFIYIYLFGSTSLSSIQDLLVVAWRIQFPVHGLNSGPLHWECRVLAPGLPEKSCLYFLNACSKWFVNAWKECSAH